MPRADTKDRILDAAEKLFAERGFDGTSIRMISSGAKVNLAAVNYHFQSKDALLDAVYERRAGPVNARRLALLDEFEAAAHGQPVPPERILEAFVRPVFELGDRVGHIPRMMVRMQYVERDSVVESIFDKHFRPVFSRLFAAMRRSLPHLSEEELFWRMQFMAGSFSHVAASGGALRVLAKGRVRKPEPEVVMQKLIQYSSAGLKEGKP